MDNADFFVYNHRVRTLSDFMGEIEFIKDGKYYETICKNWFIIACADYRRCSSWLHTNQP